MTSFGRRAKVAWLLASVSFLGMVAPVAGHGQSLTQGALRGTVVAAGLTVSEVLLSIEDETGTIVRRTRTDVEGHFNIAILAPGGYSILAEKAGYQPQRQRGITVLAGQQTNVRMAIVRRPPPIIRVEEVAIADQSFTPNSPRVTELLGGRDFAADGNRLDLAESGRFAAGVVFPATARWGFGDVVGSLPQSQSRMVLDGLPAFWLRHPGLETQPGGSSLAPPFLQHETRLVWNSADPEIPGAPGGVVNVISRPGTSRLRVEPFVTWGFAAGNPTALNPADSSLRAIQVGGLVSGTLVKDKAHFVVGGGYEQLNLPSARPWERDSAPLLGVNRPLAATIVSLAQDSFGYNANSNVQPPLRTYRGGQGSIGIDWQLSPVHMVTARAAGSRYKEKRTAPGLELLTGSDARLDSRDFLGSVALISTWANAANELRVGFQSSKRDWTDGNPSTTYLVGPAAAIGALPILPGNFKRNAFTFSEAVQVQFGPNGIHRFKTGFSYSQGTWDQDYLYGRKGIFQFANLEQLGLGSGSFFSESATDSDVSYKLREIGFFGHLQYQLSPTLSSLVGLRWDRQRLPDGEIAADTAFRAAFGLENQTKPNDKIDLGPRLGLLWNGGRNQRWLMTLIASIDHGQLNPALFSEAVLGGRRLRVRRSVGAFGTWPVAPDTTVLPNDGQRLALFGPNDKYRDPRATKFDLEIRRSLPSGFVVRVTGRYHHTDFLLRRTDLNLPSTPVGATTEGRQLWGALVQSGEMIVASPGSNRRLLNYDLVSGFSSTAAQDFYEGAAAVERSVGSGLSFAVEYALSQTRDNWLQGWTGDPVDELSPFPKDPIGGGWAKGTSDFDIPQRAVVTALWRSHGRFRVTVGGRFRYQSGFPFTPGFQPGVDANGDGSGGNDPAFIDSNIQDMPVVVSQNDCLKDQVNAFAKRNSCREPGRHAFDLSGSVALPVHSIGSRVELTLDVVNLVASRTGVYDRALVLVDPQGTLTTDGSGNVILPLVANPRFGKLLSRRDEPRILRLGLRLGN
jgi:hypothetical protein